MSHSATQSTPSKDYDKISVLNESSNVAHERKKIHTESEEEYVRTLNAQENTPFSMAPAPPSDTYPPQNTSYYPLEARTETGEFTSVSVESRRTAKIKKQLAKKKYWTPWFIRIVSAGQLILLIYSLYRNSQLTGSWIQTKPYFNWLIGPAPETLINVGARYVPCMRTTPYLGQEMLCSTGNKCELETVCGFGGFHGAAPNQWFRFITPIFLHGGVLHYIMNMVYQLGNGAQMERDMGPFRMALLYMISGIGGFIFGANFAPPNMPSVGASGALFGLIGCQVVDLVQHWRLIENPCRELTKMIILLIINFALGLLPSIDNFAHIGGFICGIFSSLLLLPTIHISSADKWIKRGLMVFGLAIVIVLFTVGLRGFYSGTDANVYCPWCKYFSCLPINGWCDTMYAN
ncbi:hypothetical protein K7432_008251 [Basidiobolus ranarum]|uniref:Rhomboid-type serine protease n=1 Tax=Basidiobolus ranarum TaxID=34480 RepID=A0ABR2VZ32_9FUNG